MSEVRRCRRCKRKRLDDEPPEVKLYKTCAKCRIIERQKKKLRKPLAEETMLYGMRQFQQQHLNANFVNDDVFMDDDMFAFKNKGPSDIPKPNEQQYSLYKFQQTPQPQRQSAVLIAQQMMPPSVQPIQPMAQQSHVLRNIQPTINVSMPVDSSRPGYSQAIHCEICANKLDLKDEMSMIYRLCPKCYLDPYSNTNVFGDFDEYLLSIQAHRYKDVKNFAFVKELDENFTNNLKSKNNSINEKQLREFLLSNIKMIYLDPIFACINYKFNQISTNINDLNSSMVMNSYHSLKPIKCWYKCIKENDSKCNSSLYVNYNIELNLIIIKLNHQAHKISRDYPKDFIKILIDLVEALKKETSRTDLGFNFITANMVYDKLFAQLAMFNIEHQNLIKSLNKEDFLSDFINLSKITGNDIEKERTTKSAMEKAETPASDEQDGAVEDADDDDEADADTFHSNDEEDDVGDALDSKEETPSFVRADLESNLVATAAGSPLTNVITKESTGEYLDPAFKPE